MAQNKYKSRILFDQHMLEVGKQKFHEKNWKEPLRKVAGDTLRNNSFLLMLSNAMIPIWFYKEFDP